MASVNLRHLAKATTRLLQCRWCREWARVSPDIYDARLGCACTYTYCRLAEYAMHDDVYGCRWEETRGRY